MRAIVLVLDSLGIGAAPDAGDYGDVGADTLGHIAAACRDGLAEKDRSGPLRIPNLERLGIGLAYALVHGRPPAALSARPELIGAYAAAREISFGKDSVSGHWELAGVPALTRWRLFPAETDSFPPELLQRIVRRANLDGYYGNCHASGTEIIARYGEEHMRTGKPIFYTSADSVFQVACHEHSFGLAPLYDLCRLIREEADAFAICRVIARPFTGTNAASFIRTANRRDLTVPPPAQTLLQKIAKAGGSVVAVGKITDIYAAQGITRTVKASGFPALWQALLHEAERQENQSLIMVNFVDFDQAFGHRRDISGYAAALEAFDARLPELFLAAHADALVCLTADHGCDPSWKGSDHTREYVPMLLHNPKLHPRCLGLRASFADLAQTLTRCYGLEPMSAGVDMFGS